MNYTCGIDFGTTNSTIGVIKNDTPQIVPIENGHHSIPTALFFKNNETTPLFGRNAINEYINGTEGRFIRSIKRILGSDLMGQRTYINNEPKSFDELIFLFLKHLKNEAENYLNNSISSTVIGRPVHFQDNDSEADRLAEKKLYEIAQKVGFKDIFFQYEPIAAAFSHEKELNKESLALVVDLGGGTSDFSVIKLGPHHISNHDRKNDILGTSGIRVGGNDFDREFSLNTFMIKFGKGTTYGSKKLPCPNYLFSDLSEWSKINFVYTQQNLSFLEKIKNISSNTENIENLINLIEFQEAHHLLKIVEDCKIKLTNETSFRAEFKSISNNIDFFIKNDTFEEAIKFNVNRIIQNMYTCLKSAQIQPSAIDLVILTGGSCEIPLIQKEFHRIFLNAKFSDKNKLLSVGMGLTYAAQNLA